MVRAICHAFPCVTELASGRGQMTKRFGVKRGTRGFAGTRRGGASAAFDRLNKYFTINCMPIVASQYWNSVHGNTPDETRRDLEGLQTMRTLGENMAWLLEDIEKAAIAAPAREPWTATNFIR